jgi:hypothetical protein
MDDKLHLLVCKLQERWMLQETTTNRKRRVESEYISRWT